MAEHCLVKFVLSIQCMGRDANGSEVLKQPISVKLLVRQECGDEKISHSRSSVHIIREDTANGVRHRIRILIKLATAYFVPTAWTYPIPLIIFLKKHSPLGLFSFLLFRCRFSFFIFYFSFQKVMHSCKKYFSFVK